MPVLRFFFGPPLQFGGCGVFVVAEMNVGDLSAPCSTHGRDLSLPLILWEEGLPCRRMIDLGGVFLLPV